MSLPASLLISYGIINETYGHLPLLEHRPIYLAVVVMSIVSIFTYIMSPSSLQLHLVEAHGLYGSCLESNGSSDCQYFSMKSQREKHTHMLCFSYMELVRYPTYYWKQKMSMKSALYFQCHPISQYPLFSFYSLG